MAGGRAPLCAACLRARCCGDAPRGGSAPQPAPLPTLLLRVQAAGEAVGEFVPPVAEATHSLAAGFQGETSGGGKGSQCCSSLAAAQCASCAERTKRLGGVEGAGTHSASPSALPPATGLHDGGTAGGSTYGFGETAAAGPTPGTASAQVPTGSSSLLGAAANTGSAAAIRHAPLRVAPAHCVSL